MYLSLLFYASNCELRLECLGPLEVVAMAIETPLKGVPRSVRRGAVRRGIGTCCFWPSWWPPLWSCRTSS